MAVVLIYLSLKKENLPKGQFATVSRSMKVIIWGLPRLKPFQMGTWTYRRLVPKGYVLKQKNPDSPFW